MKIYLIFISILFGCSKLPSNSNKNNRNTENMTDRGTPFSMSTPLTLKGSSIECSGTTVIIPRADKHDPSNYLLILGIENSPHLESQTFIDRLDLYKNCIKPLLVSGQTK